MLTMKAGFKADFSFCFKTMVRFSYDENIMLINAMRRCCVMQYKTDLLTDTEQAHGSGSTKIWRMSHTSATPMGKLNVQF